MRVTQIPPNQPGLADECVARATVSLDELTVQPDFPYDDSEVPDDDTVSVQSTLPQKSEQLTVNCTDV